MNTRELLRLLVCPRCLGGLRAIEQDGVAGGLACDACELVYPVRDGIPVMLEDEAIPADKWPPVEERG